MSLKAGSMDITVKRTSQARMQVDSEGLGVQNNGDFLLFWEASKVAVCFPLPESLIVLRQCLSAWV